MSERIEQVKLQDGTLIRHKVVGYEGRIDGRTGIKTWADISISCGGRGGVHEANRAAQGFRNPGRGCGGRLLALSFLFPQQGWPHRQTGRSLSMWRMDLSVLLRLLEYGNESC